MADEEVKKKPVDVDINSADLQMEEIDVNPEGDAFAAPAPPPEGIYMAQLSRSEGKSWQAGTSKKNQAYLATSVTAKLLTGDGEKYDGALVFDNFVSTLIMDNSGTCRIAGIMKVGGQPISGKVNAADLARKFDSYLSGDPSLKVQIKWRGYCKSCEKNTINSMKKFPPNAAGTGHKGEAECPKCGDTVKAQTEIEKYLPVS